MTVSNETRLKALTERLATELAETEESIARIERDVAELTQDVADEGGVPATHPADEGTDLFDIERAQTLRVAFEVRLEQIRTAQARIADGTYGQCANCGKKIPVARLEALPHATLCIDCQAVSEQ